MSVSVPAPITPNQDTVLGRSLALATLLVRGQIERALQSPSAPELTLARLDLAARLTPWLNEQDFTAHFTMDELAALSQPAGAWSEVEYAAQFTRTESWNTLLWALNILPQLPPCDQPAAALNLEPWLGWLEDALDHPDDPRLFRFPTTDIAWLQQSAALRSTPVLNGQRAAAECWQWRVQVAALQRANVPAPGGMDYPMLIAITAEEAHAAGAIPRPVQNDFPISGRPFAQLSEDEVYRVSLIVPARQVALNWLCGFATEWDHLPTVEVAA